MQELVRVLQELQDRLKATVAQLRLSASEAAIEDLTTLTTAPDFWDNSAKAVSTSQQLGELQKYVDGWKQLEKEIGDTLELARLVEADDEALETEIRQATERLAALFGARELELRLSGPHDRASAIVEIHAGSGGTDAQDWAAMLLRMYLRWAESHDYSTDILSISLGEEAGLKSVILEVTGLYAYGKLKSEAGVHRLVRLSPFNSNNLRQTSFALVEVLPQLERSAQLEIDPKDLRIDVYRASGHGGQSVNTTDSAVRITHLPTGIVVAIQNERSQLQNREQAMTVLRARLSALAESQRQAQLSDLRASDTSAAWGQQIRNYVLHPYTKVKDVRTGAETSQAQDVLDGDLDLFIDAYLHSKIGQE